MARYTVDARHLTLCTTVHFFTIRAVFTLFIIFTVFRHWVTIPQLNPTASTTSSVSVFIALLRLDTYIYHTPGAMQPIFSDFQQPQVQPDSAVLVHYPHREHTVIRPQCIGSQLD